MSSILGKASEIKTTLVQEVAGTPFDETLNLHLEVIGDKEIIDIQFKATADTDGQAWFNALIIFKEDNIDAY